MSTQEHFKDSFWSPTPTKEDIPNYAKGLRVLHERLEHSVIENKVIVNFLQQRINNELQCARSLSFETLSVSMNSGLKNAFDMVVQESKEAAQYHRVRSKILSEDVLKPIHDFTRTFEDKILIRKNRMEDEISAFEHTVQSALMIRAVYLSKCRTLELACPDFRPTLPEGFEEEDDDEHSNDEFVGGRRRRSSSVTSELNVDGASVRLGDCTEFTYREIARSMKRLQTMVEGTTTNTVGSRKYLGKNVFEWVRDFMATVRHDVTLDTESQKICEKLVALKFLKSVPKESTGFSFDRYYEVQKNIVQRYIHRTRIKINDYSSHSTQHDSDHQVQNMTLEVPHNNSSPVGVLNGFFGKFKSKSETTSTHKEMNEANEAYKKKIKFVNSLRKKLEESLVSYFDEMERLEMNRIITIKQAFKMMATSLSNTLPMYKETYDKILLFQEALKPEQDIHSIIEQYKTGYFYPKPFIYENYFHGSAVDQTFGVPLEEITQLYGSHVPPVISRGIKLIESGIETKGKSKDKDALFEEVWSNVIPLKQMNIYCEKLDSLSGSQLKAILETYDLNVLANLIRVFLLELPECLLTFDLYDPMKAIYAKQQDKLVRLSAVNKLLETLPPSNYHTLKALCYHLFKLIKQIRTVDDMLNKLISMFAFILMRPRISSTNNVHDRHPKKLARDLFTQYHDIFTVRSQQNTPRKLQIDTSTNDYFGMQRPKIQNRGSAPPSSFPNEYKLALRRALSTKIPRSSLDFDSDEICYSPGGSLILPQNRMTLLFDDPEHSEPTTPTFIQQQQPNSNKKAPVDKTDHVDTERLSSDLSLMLSTDDEEEENDNRLDIPKRKPNRSRASTRGTMDNVVLDSFFDD